MCLNLGRLSKPRMQNKIYEKCRSIPRGFHFRKAIKAKKKRLKTAVLVFLPILTCVENLIE